MTSHDRLFKKLLTMFFAEFIDLFLPQVSNYLDPRSIVFVDKELFTDDGRREADLVVQARFRGKDSLFLVHTEVQAQHQADFAQRMFGYFAKLHDKFELPVYPIALFSFEKPTSSQLSYYAMDFPDTRVLRFDFRVIQLNRLSWRAFVKHMNPMAAALMARMKIAPKDRPIVKLECLRLLVTLRLDRKRKHLISGFVDTYLRLTAEEMKQYAKRRSKLAEPEQEAIMELETSWSIEGRKLGRKEGFERGLKKGLQEGREAVAEIITALLRRRLGSIKPALRERVQNLAPEQLKALGEALLDFGSTADLEDWLRTAADSRTQSKRTQSRAR